MCLVALSLVSLKLSVYRYESKQKLPLERYIISSIAVRVSSGIIARTQLHRAFHQLLPTNQCRQCIFENRSYHFELSGFHPKKTSAPPR